LVWFLDDPGRLAQEKAAVERLESEADWLGGAVWGLSSGLHLDAVIRAGGRDYEVTMAYPEVFPATPPIVRPKNRDERWSDHQWGTGGSLCLEWGPDNWCTDITGAEMLRSAHRLLSTENPLGEGPSMAVPSRHKTSVGQELSGKLLRFYAGGDLLSCLAELTDGAEGTLEACLKKQGESYVCVIRRLRPSGLRAWEDPSVPAALYNEMDEMGPPAGLFYNTRLDAGDIREARKVGDLERLLGEAGHGDVVLGAAGPHPQGLKRRPDVVLLADDRDEPHLFMLFADGDVLRAAPVRSEARGPNPRLPEDSAGAAGKTVGVVGLGSLGSKLAASLARSGVRRFVLVEADVLLPENLVRNDLDWRDVGQHKVHAVKRRLGLLAPGVEVEVRDLDLTGQESNANVAGALKRLGGCDVIVDATADPDVFNLLAHAAKTYAKPMVWAKVYAGGVGGMVARSRPGLDPAPARMRAAYHEVVADSPEPATPGEGPYAAEEVDGAPFVASDADVAVVAGHAAGLALDTMVRAVNSAYPDSMYLVGLREGWVFEQPFHNIPITMQGLPEEMDEAADLGAESEGWKFLRELVEKETGASASDE
jgi:hypothetical protein